MWSPHSSPCCLQAVTDWIKTLQPVLAITSKSPETSRRSYSAAISLNNIYKLKAWSRVSVPVTGPLNSAGNTIIFSPRPTLSTSLFTGIELNFIIENRAAAHACSCHADTIGQRTNGVQRRGREGGGYQNDILIISLA